MSEFPISLTIVILVEKNALVAVFREFETVSAGFSVRYKFYFHFIVNQIDGVIVGRDRRSSGGSGKRRLRLHAGTQRERLPEPVRHTSYRFGF